MRIALITAGGAGMFCGSCMSDNTLAAELQRQEVDAQLIPLYTPIRTDQPDVAIDRVFYSGLSVYLDQKAQWLSAIPLLGSAARWLADQPWMIRAATSLGIETSAAELGELAVSVLRGEEGNQWREVEQLCDYLARDVKPDVVDLSNALIGGSVREIKKRVGVPVIATLQGDDFFLGGLTETYKTQAMAELKRIAKEIDGFIVHSHYYAQLMGEMLDLPPEKVHVVPLGIEVRDFLTIDTSASGVREPAVSRPPTIGYLARLAPEKGLHQLVDAFILLKKEPQWRDARLRIAGWLGGKNGPYAEEQFAKLKKAGLGEVYDYAGAVDRKGKLEFLRSLDVFSVPTVYREPKGLFALEAMAAGVPVVLPDHGALPEMIADTQGGRLVRPEDPAHLAETLGQLLNDSAARQTLGSQGRAAVHARRTAATMAAATMRVYENVLGERLA